METSSVRKESQPALEMSTAARLAEASRRIGGLEALARAWPLWHGFARGPLTSLAALGELQAKGMWLDISRLLALGPEPEASRPDLPLRWGVGFISALRELENWDLAKPLTPSLVGRIHGNIDAPHLSRGIRSLGDGVIEEAIGGTAVWTLAPRWQKANRPPGLGSGPGFRHLGKGRPGHRPALRGRPRPALGLGAPAGHNRPGLRLSGALSATGRLGPTRRHRRPAEILAQGRYLANLHGGVSGCPYRLGQGHPGACPWRAANSPGQHRPGEHLGPGSPPPPRLIGASHPPPGTGFAPDLGASGGDPTHRRASGR